MVAVKVLVIEGTSGQAVVAGLGVPLVWHHDGGVLSSHTTEVA